MKTATPTDEEIAIALMQGVSRAQPNGSVEECVVTFITPKMLMAFFRFTDGPLLNIFGSRIVVIERPGMWAASRAMRRPKK